MIINKEAFLKYLRSEQHPVSIHELRRHYNVHERARRRFKRFLDELVDTGAVIKLKGDLFGIAEEMNMVTGILKGNPAGFGFIRPEGEGEDVYVNGMNMNGAMHGDSVVARVQKSREGFSGEVIRILTRANATVVGNYEQDKFFGFVIPDNKKIWHHVYVPKEESKGVKKGQKVVAEITAWPEKGRNPEGRVIEILGSKDDPAVDVKTVIRQYNLPDVFPADVKAETSRIKHSIPEEEIKNRVDLRNEVIFTIDGEDAKDFDDAVSLKKGKNGEYELGVHIADVSYYVKEGTAIDREALLRGNSVYLPGTVIPMLPEALSNEMCSLRPDEDRLTVTASIKLSPEGKVLSTRILKSVIRSKRRMTYTKVSDIIEKKDKELREEYRDIVKDLELMHGLALLLNGRRMADGGIDFNLGESKVIVDAKGVPLRVERITRNWAHRLIEEFMLLANEVVSTRLFREGLVNIYRIHETPDQEDLVEFSRFVATLGYSFRATKDFAPRALQSLLAKVKGTPEEAVINKLALRAMKLAVYSTEAKGHFALAKQYYSHFTSPIRRYPDLATHRAIKNLLDKEKVNFGKFEYIAKHCSDTERSAQDAEEDVVKLKKIQLIKSQPAKIYEGIISGVQAYGMFVEILDFALEGLVHISSLANDYYNYDEKSYSLVGKHKKKIYRLGDHVKVTITKADLDKKQLDLALS
ncbi:MAG: ribonuclease R [Candidatus Firestonebacteria bacterium]